MKNFNDWLALRVTNGVATMWCAYVFAGLAVYGGTGVDWHNSFQIVSWISQTFLQLVLLSIIMVGQKVSSSAADIQAKEMHDTVMQSHEELRELVQNMNEMMKEVHAEHRGGSKQKSDPS